MKFEFKYKSVQVKQHLADMGAQALFQEALSVDQLVVTDVVHEAKIIVDQDGTEAAAATAIVVGESAGPKINAEVKVNRPTLFFIMDTKTHQMMFMGRLGQP